MKIRNLFAVIALMAGCVGWNAGADAVNTIDGWGVPTIEFVEEAEAHTVTNFKVTQTWPGPLWAFECKNASGTITIQKDCTPAQYQMIVGHGGANGAHVTLVDGDPTKPPGQDGSDGDTKDTAPHMEQVAVSNGPGGNVTVVLANQ